MAITDNQTAMHVDTLLMFLLPVLQPGWRTPVSADDAKTAATALADAAHKKMGAGSSGAEVERAWIANRARFARLQGDPQPYERDEREYLDATVGGAR